MKLDLSKPIAGLPVKTARDLMRELHHGYIDTDSVLEFLNTDHWRRTVDAAREINPLIPKSLRRYDHDAARKEYCKIWRFKFTPIKLAHAKRVLAGLLAEGYLEPNEPEHKNDKRKYQLSMSGRRLSATNLTKRFDRTKADREIVALIARANEINMRDELVFFVHKITAFGSYLTDSNDLGDIDLVVETSVRRPGGDHVKESHYRAANSGKTLDFSGSLFYGQREVEQLLRARKARLSFASATTVERMNTDTRVLFEWMPDTERRVEMEAFDWRLHEPLRQVKEWLSKNPGLNSDPIEIARWCQDVATMLRKPKSHHHRLFRDWSNNATQDILPYWGMLASEAASLIAHQRHWEGYCEHVSFWITADFRKEIDACVEAEIYAHFVRGTEDGMDAAILIAKHFGWRLIKDDSDSWSGPLERRMQEMDKQDPSTRLTASPQ